MDKLLSLLDEMINDYIEQHSASPLAIVANKETKDKILALYNAFLDDIDPDHRSITRFPDCYRGISIEVDENEPFMRVR